MNRGQLNYTNSHHKRGRYHVIPAADALRARGFVPRLFHARFAMQDRMAIEQTVIDRFWSDMNRPERASLMRT